LGDGIASGLGGQSGGTGHTGVDLDDGVLEAVGVQSELAVTAALDLQSRDDIQSGGTQHLELLIGQGLGGSHHDGVAGVHANGVDVLHGTHGDDVASGVTEHLELHFLPTGNAALNQNLVDAAEVNAAVGDLPQGGLVVGNAAAGAAQGV